MWLVVLIVEWAMGYVIESSFAIYCSEQHSRIAAINVEDSVEKTTVHHHSQQYECFPRIDTEGCSSELRDYGVLTRCNLPIYITS
jgi:hypothetical protein